MKKTLRYLSFALALGLVATTSQQCSEPQEKAVPVLTSTCEDPKTALIPYVSVEGLEYKLNISHEDASELGVSLGEFHEFEELLSSINKAAAFESAENPQMRIALYDPNNNKGQIAESRYMPPATPPRDTLKTVNGSMNLFDNYYAAYPARRATHKLYLYLWIYPFYDIETPPMIEPVRFEAAIENEMRGLSYPNGVWYSFVFPAYIDYEISYTDYFIPKPPGTTCEAYMRFGAFYYTLQPTGGYEYKPITTGGRVIYQIRELPR